MNKPVKPVKPVKKRAPKKREKPVQYFDSKVYTFDIEANDEFTLFDFLKERKIPVDKISFKDIKIDLETIYAYGEYGEEFKIYVTVPERHENLDYYYELNVWQRNQKDYEEYEKVLVKYEKDLEKYNRDYQKWLEFETKRLELEQIEQAKELLKSKGIKL
jgi:hypothetical protein